MHRVTALFACLLLSACAESPTPVTGCTAAGGITPDCRFRNPEDIVLLPDGKHVIVSQFGSMDGARAGNLALYSLVDASIQVLYPTDAVEHKNAWGDAACARPDQAAFSPHGIDLERRSDGRLMLLVVNHGLRESVEFFEVADSGDLTWRGCTVGPDNAYFNDVVARRDGGFWVTHMMPKDAQTSSLLGAILLGSDTGHVFSWSTTDGYRVVPGSHGPFPNGIEKAEDESTLFINLYLGDEVVKLDLAAGKVTAAAQVQSPDNSTWSLDGRRLLVASHTDSLLESTRCADIEAGSCGFAFQVVSIDPADMSRSTVFEHRGAPMGAVTVARDIGGGTLLFGTYAGDRIGRAELP